MKKFTINSSSQRIFFLILFPVFVILWFIGWVMYYEGSCKEYSVSAVSEQTTIKKNCYKNESEPDILEAKLTA